MIGADTVSVTLPGAAKRLNKCELELRMPYVPLKRRFSRWRDENTRGVDFSQFERQFYGEVSWEELLKFQRVIILAEAGSGKSKELEEQAKRVALESFAFHATVRNVAEEGLAGAMDQAGRERLEAWKNSEAVGWFFIDSVDEAKLDHIRFGDALRKLGDGLGGGLARARIIISGRYSGWEFRADLHKLEESLPIAEVGEQQALDPHQLLSSILRNTFRDKKRAERQKPLVVLMAPLDGDQVREFAKGHGIEDLNKFISALDRDNLWHLAMRPLDLQWLVDYWQNNKRFGRLSEMLEASIRARLQEENPEHGSRDDLSVEQAMAGLERIGAAMVFGRRDRIELPDTEIALGASEAFKLRDVLPDWPSEHLPMLLARPIFDPASPGQVRLHNDNQSVVRSYLAARWLKGRLNRNAPKSRVLDLIFADADGVPIVLPSVRETAAWLATWDEEIAREIVRRDPSLLLTAGDPTGLSRDIRQAALEGTFREYASGVKRYSMLDHDTLRRFATADIMPALQQGWTSHGTDREVRRLVLSMIEAGPLPGGLAIVREAVAGSYDDPLTTLLAIRALRAIGESADFETLATKVETESATLDDAFVWEALDTLFPKHLSVAAFVKILPALISGNDSSQLEWRGKRLIERLHDRGSLRTLLSSLVSIIQPPVANEDGTFTSAPADLRLKPLLQTVATRLLKLLPIRSIDPLIIDAAIQLAGDRYGERRDPDDEFGPLLRASPERRRAGLWRAVEVLKDHPHMRRHGLTDLWQLDYVGWPSGLCDDDIPWLIDDVANGDDQLRRHLALSALMFLWRGLAKPDDLLARIKEAAEDSQPLKDFIEGWLAPPQPNPMHEEHLREMERMRQEHEEREAERDKSWFDFVDDMKSDPEQLRTPPPNLAPGHADSRLYHIWLLLESAGEERTGFAIDDFGVLADLLGLSLTKEATDALIRFWRTHHPTLTSSREPDARNVSNKIDSMGIAGVTLEARRDPNWVQALTSEEATIAAELSTQELNGFPHWITTLAEAWPDEVQAVFVHEVMDHLAIHPDQHGFLDKITRADAPIPQLVAPALITYVQALDDAHETTLSKIFRIIRNALPNLAIQPGFVDLALERFAAASSFAVAATYLSFAMTVAPDRGVAALSAKLDQLSEPDQKGLAENVLPSVFGDGWFSGGISPAVLPFDVLDRLVRIAFRTIKHEDDVVHEGVYSPGTRDHAENARGGLFKQLYETPGRGTVEALRRLSEDPDQPIPRSRIDGLIYDRASEDAEHARWAASEAFELERDFDCVPQTPRDLQLVALSRLNDLNHDLHHHRFSQGQTFKRLPKEVDVQKWLAWEIERAGGRAFTLEREPHVAEEKEPDIRLQSRMTTASLPLEIKVAESLSLRKLEEAVTVQLAGRYLRERDQRHGVLVVAHQRKRGEGWKNEQDQMLSFPEVIDHLKLLAHRLGAGGSNAARVEIAVIDVSDVVLPEDPKEPEQGET